MSYGVFGAEKVKISFFVVIFKQDIWQDAAVQSRILQ